MKKKVMLMMMAGSILLVGLAGCKKKTTCDFCGEEAYCTEYDLDGETANMCKECKDGLESLLGEQ